MIRPLLLVEKKYIISAARKWELPYWQNPCPSAGKTSRSDMAETLKTLYGVTDNARRCIFNGLTRWQFDQNCRDYESRGKEAPRAGGRESR